MTVKAKVAAVAASVVALSAGPALAFECFNANRSSTGNAAAAGSAALMSFQEALEQFAGLCPAGAQHVIAGLDGLGYDTSLLINGRSLMAGGLEKNGKGETKLHDGQGIDHLSPQFFADADPLIVQAFGICSG
jgi:hypothetical protein